MSNIKLQVGKTYRNRKGQEVKIVRYDGHPEFPYLGSNDKWYTKSGNFWYSEHPEDLIEEVPEIRHTFTIANGVKTMTIEQVGNRIIMDMISEERKEPKPGDVMINHMGNIYIFKSVRNDKGHNVFTWFGDDGSLLFDGWSLSGRPATPEEAKLLFDALKKEGKQWNPETMEVEDVPEIDHIRKWVEKHLDYRYYNHESLTKVIYNYLKYKEGEK